MKTISCSFLTILTALFLLSSCQKEELVSTELVREFQIDTIFSHDLGMQEFNFSERQFYCEPIIKDDDIYFVVLEDPGVLDALHKVVKIDAFTGAVLWTWGDYQTGDPRYPQKITYDEGRILVVTSNNAYVLNANTGHTLHVYTAKGEDLFRGAALLGGHLFVGLVNTDSGNTRLEKVALNGSTPPVSIKQLEHTSDFRPFSLSVDIMEFRNIPYIFWQVSNTANAYSNKDLYFGAADNADSFEVLGLGSSRFNSGFKRAHLLAGSEHDLLFAMTNGGSIGAYDIFYYAPLQWIDDFQGDWLLQNSDNLYAVTKGSIAVFDKSTGKQKANSNQIARVGAATDEFLVAGSSSLSGNALRLYDSETLGLLQDFETRSSIIELFKINEKDFFFADTHDGGRVGRIRITPLNK